MFLHWGTPRLNSVQRERHIGRKNAPETTGSGVSGAMFGASSTVPEVGLEPTRPRGQRILNTLPLWRKIGIQRRSGAISDVCPKYVYAHFMHWLIFRG